MPNSRCGRPEAKLSNRGFIDDTPPGTRKGAAGVRAGAKSSSKRPKSVQIKDTEFGTYHIYGRDAAVSQPKITESFSVEERLRRAKDTEHASKGSKLRLKRRVAGGANNQHLIGVHSECISRGIGPLLIDNRGGNEESNEDRELQCNKALPRAVS